MEIHFEIENQCILSCKHCSSVSSRSLQMRQNILLNVKNLLSCFDKPINVFLTGGEPLLNVELLNTIKVIKLKNDKNTIGLFSTGLMYNEQGNIEPISKEYAKKLKHAGLSICYMSIYSNISTEHDFITGQVHSFEMTKCAAKNLSSFDIDIRANVVVTKLNIGKLEEIIVQLLSESFSEIRLLKLVNHGNASKNWEVIGVSEEEYIEAIEKIKDKYGDAISISGYPEICKCRPFNDAIKCQAGINLLYVTYCGEVYPCACVKNQKKFLVSNICDCDKVESYLNSTNIKYREKCLSSK